MAWEPAVMVLDLEPVLEPEAVSLKSAMGIGCRSIDLFLGTIFQAQYLPRGILKMSAHRPTHRLAS